MPAGRHSHIVREHDQKWQLQELQYARKRATLALLQLRVLHERAEPLLYGVRRGPIWHGQFGEVSRMGETSMGEGGEGEGQQAEGDGRELGRVFRKD